MAHEAGRISGRWRANLRYDMTKHVLISTCGFYSVGGSYDSVTKMFVTTFLARQLLRAFSAVRVTLPRKGGEELSARTDSTLRLSKGWY